METEAEILKQLEEVENQLVEGRDHWQNLQIEIKLTEEWQQNKVFQKLNLQSKLSALRSENG